jgi:hypothetical protein
MLAKWLKAFGSQSFWPTDYSGSPNWQFAESPLRLIFAAFPSYLKGLETA